MFPMGPFITEEIKVNGSVEINLGTKEAFRIQATKALWLQKCAWNHKMIYLQGAVLPG